MSDKMKIKVYKKLLKMSWKANKFLMKIIVEAAKDMLDERL